MQQRRGVHELDRCGELVLAVAVIADSSAAASVSIGRRRLPPEAIRWCASSGSAPRRTRPCRGYAVDPACISLGTISSRGLRLSRDRRPPRDWGSPRTRTPLWGYPPLSATPRPCHDRSSFSHHQRRANWRGQSAHRPARHSLPVERPNLGGTLGGMFELLRTNDAVILIPFTRR